METNPICKTDCFATTLTEHEYILMLQLPKYIEALNKCVTVCVKSYNLGYKAARENVSIKNLCVGLFGSYLVYDGVKDLINTRFSNRKGVIKTVAGVVALASLYL